VAFAAYPMDIAEDDLASAEAVGSNVGPMMEVDGRLWRGRCQTRSY
jgi:hypothetical protein